MERRRSTPSPQPSRRRTKTFPTDSPEPTPDSQASWPEQLRARPTIPRRQDLAASAFRNPQAFSPLLGIEFRHLGGALGRAPEGAGALSSLQGRFAAYMVGMVIGPEAAAAIERHIATTQDGLAPWSTGGAYLNFTESPIDAGNAFGTTTVRRLRDIAEAIDPDRVMRPNHQVRAY